MAKEKVGGVVVMRDALINQQRRQIAELAAKYRLPSISVISDYAQVGGLMNYGADFSDNYRRVGLFVEKILKGVKPGDIPFEQPTRYYLEINRNTAQKLGIQINNELLTRADRVIE